jgi:peptidoglycan/xylan/chitin deacetylase (PgdA/CDA1 family)
MIVYYHKIDLKAPTSCWMTVDTFYENLVSFRQTDKKVVYLDDYDPQNPDHLVITFDDGYENVLTWAAPLLQALKFPFEVFVIGDYIGVTDPSKNIDRQEPFSNFATKEQLQKMIKMGGRLQWHTRTHPRFKNVFDRKRIIHELTIPDDIRKLDKTGFQWLAYPYGKFNDIVVEEAKKRFKGAFSTTFGNTDDIYKWNRTPMKEVKLLKDIVGKIISF